MRREPTDQGLVGSSAGSLACFRFADPSLHGVEMGKKE
jgi:hypothetical protein